MTYSLSDDVIKTLMARIKSVLEDGFQSVWIYVGLTLIQIGHDYVRIERKGEMDTMVYFDKTNERPYEMRGINVSNNKMYINLGSFDIEIQMDKIYEIVHWEDSKHPQCDEKETYIYSREDMI